MKLHRSDTCHTVGELRSALATYDATGRGGRFTVHEDASGRSCGQHLVVSTGRLPLPATTTEVVSGGRAIQRTLTRSVPALCFTPGAPEVDENGAAVQLRAAPPTSAIGDNQTPADLLASIDALGLDDATPLRLPVLLAEYPATVGRPSVATSRNGDVREERTTVETVILVELRPVWSASGEITARALASLEKPAETETPTARRRAG